MSSSRSVLVVVLDGDDSQVILDDIEQVIRQRMDYHGVEDFGVSFTTLDTNDVETVAQATADAAAWLATV